MIDINDVRDVHIELTTLCNARCPLCVRNANGYPYNSGYPEVSLTLNQIKKILDSDFLKQLTSINICGNFGDFVANAESLEIIDYVATTNPRMKIIISTNGGARDITFWKGLAQYKTEIYFCIEGLEDTHSTYRVDTSFSQVLKNAKAYIDAGGQATWKMIEFDHNKHQIEQCQQLAKELGFKHFLLADHGRISGSVFDRNGNYQYHIGDGNKCVDIKPIIQWKKYSEKFTYPEPKKSLNCYSKREKSIYIAANGEVYPCCYLGFYPRTFTNGFWFSARNQQISDLLADKDNNALTVGIKAAIDWFNAIEEKWTIESYESGRLLGCDEHCGSNRYIEKLL